MRPVRVLPEGYQAAGTLDLSRGTWTLLAMQVAALVLFFASAWLFVYLALVMSRIGDPERSSLAGLAGLPATQMLWEVLVALILMIPLHEGAHGLFFWLFTGERPRFGFVGSYAYAAAPDWYIPRNQHLLVGLAPLVLLSAAGTILLSFVSAPVLFLVLAVLVLNAAGSVGDLVMTVWIIARPKSALIRDAGDAITLYVPVQKNGGYHG